jgi:hypothetical protein
VAYGARLESVLGESPQGFESPILRQMHESPARIRPAGLSSCGRLLEVLQPLGRLPLGVPLRAALASVEPADP